MFSDLEDARPLGFLSSHLSGQFPATNQAARSAVAQCLSRALANRTFFALGLTNNDGYDDIMIGIEKGFTTPQLCDEIMENQQS